MVPLPRDIRKKMWLGQEPGAVSTDVAVLMAVAHGRLWHLRRASGSSATTVSEGETDVVGDADDAIDYQSACSSSGVR
jgi:hypothetical protein